MAPQPAPGPTGNALSDANNQTLPPGFGAGFTVTNLADTVNSVNQMAAKVASDCIWPPSAQVTIPFIPGVFSQSFQLPCLLSYGEARAIIGVGLLLGGLLIVQFGVTLMIAESVIGVVGYALGGGKGKAAAAGAAAPATFEVALAA